MSVRSSISPLRPSACSGAMNAGVPCKLPAWVSNWLLISAATASDISLESSSLRPSGAESFSARYLAMPQSINITSPKLPSITLAGLRSRCRIPLLWAKPMALQTEMNTSSNVFSVYLQR